MNRYGKLTAILTGCVLLFITSMLQAQGPKMPKATVRVEKAAMILPVTQKKYNGKIDPIEKVTSLARISGDIVKMDFTEGAVVQKGQLLFEIDPTRFQATVDAKKAGIKGTEAKLEKNKSTITQIEARVAYAKKDYDRKNELFQQGKVVTQDEVENAESILNAYEAELAGAKADLATTEASLSASQAELILAQDDLNHTKICSEIQGRAGRTFYTPGNYVTPNSGPLITVIQMDPIYIRFSMGEKDFITLFQNIDKLKEIASLELKLADGTIYSGKGKISFADNEISPTSNTINIWATFENAKEVLRPGGVVSVILSIKEKEMKPSTRSSAILFDSKSHYIYVVDKTNKIQRRDVVLGPYSEGYQTILSGLNEGEVVVIDGTHKAMPGTEVIPVYPEAKKQ